MGGTCQIVKVQTKKQGRKGKMAAVKVQSKKQGRKGKWAEPVLKEVQIQL